jgi:pimeloyl-ACP methyl ester carboxylesterase
MSDENLRIYIEGITRKTENRYELVYSPEWESRIYLTGLRDFDIWRGLPKLEVPTLFIRGAETDTFLENTAKLVKRMQPKVRVETLENSTHLLPLERPQEVFDMMQSFLKETLRECLRTRQKGKGQANLLDDQITTRIPDRSQ